ncbi:unnamed protein product, partial [Didymodactylos carnosus]
WFEYFGTNEYFCYINFVNGKQLVIAIPGTYALPLAILAIVNVWIWQYVRLRLRRTPLMITLTTQRRLPHIKRDIEKLKNISLSC